MVLAVVAPSDQPNRIALVLIVFGIGVRASINGPTFLGHAPRARRPRRPPGCRSRPQLGVWNTSWVVGPILGGFTAAMARRWFTANGLTYLFVVWAVATVHADFSPKATPAPRRGVRSAGCRRRRAGSVKSWILI